MKGCSLGRAHIHLVLLAAAAIAASCDNPVATILPGKPAELAIISGSEQEGTVGTLLPSPLVVRVLDAEGRPVGNQLLSFRVVSGGGSLFSGAGLTNADGIAQERWTLGTVARDTQKVEVRAVDNATGDPIVFATFTATGKADVPSAIEGLADDLLSAPAGMPLADSAAVRVLDKYGNPVPGAPVVWTVRSGSGTVSPDVSNTDTNGVARAQWTLGPTLNGAQTLDAAAGIGLSTELHAAATSPTGARIAITSGNAQQAIAGSELAEPLTVQVSLNDGRPVAGATVTWTAASGTALPLTSVTDANGYASTRWQLGTKAGGALLNVDVAGAVPASFVATALVGPLSGLLKSSGDAQSGNVSSELANPLTVQAVDANGNPISGTAVTWSVTGGGGSVSPVSSTTGSDGKAAARWTLGQVSGSGSVTATAMGVPAVIFTSTAQAAITITIQSPGTGVHGSDTLHVAAQTASANEVVSVSATIGSQQTDLSYTNGAWRGVFVLSALPPGTIQLDLTARDVSGNSAIVTRSFTLDRKPQLRVIAPVEGFVTPGEVRIVAECEDDSGTCIVRSGTAQAEGRLDTTVMVTTTGSWAYVNVYATDPAGQRVDANVRVYMHPGPLWREVAAGGSRAIDFDGSRLLFVETSGGTHALRLGRTPGDTLLLTRVPVGADTESGWPTGRLTPPGALFKEYASSNNRIFELRGNSVVVLGDGQIEKVVGSWGLYKDEDGALVRRNLTAGTDQVLTGGDPTGSGVTGDLLSDGTAVYSYAARIYRHPTDNGPTRLTNPTVSLFDLNPRASGRNIIFTRVSSCCPNVTRAIVLLSDGEETVLSPLAPRVISAGRDYEAAGDWLAYTKPGGGGVIQIWIRDPEGAERQVWSYGTSSWIAALSPTGEVMFEREGRRYLAVPPYSSAPTDVGYASGGVWWLNGEWHLSLGRSVFALE